MAMKSGPENRTTEPQCEHSRRFVDLIRGLQERQRNAASGTHQ